MEFQFQENGKYLVRDLIQIPTNILVTAKEAASITLVFDDGEIESTSRECVHARFCWELYSLFPYIVVSKRHHLFHYRRRLKGDTTDEIMNDIQWACINECRNYGIEISLKETTDKIFEIVDQIDKYYHSLRQHTVFVDSMSFLDLQHHPEIWEANESLRTKKNIAPADIGKCYGVVKRVIDTDKQYKYSPLVMGGRCGGVKVPQLNKCVSALGYITDVDSVMFPYPVIDSFCTGITSIRDLIMESRTAAMSIFYQKHAMQQSEYLTRMLQLICECMYRVVRGDCGSTRYLEVPIRDMKDLKDMLGIWYLDPVDGIERPITKRSVHLCKTVVRVRTVLHCQLPDRYGVCSKCYGQIADSLFDTDNIGHIAATILQRIMTQSLLSNKHLVMSADSERIILSADDQQFMKAQPDDPSEFFINPKLKGKRVTMSFAEGDAARLQDLMFIEDLQSSSPMRLTQLETLIFRIYNKDTLVHEYPVLVSSTAQKSFFTIPMLEYIRKVGWSVDASGNYEIPLDGWDFDSQISAVGVPLVQYSTPAHMKAVKEMLTTSTESGKDNKYSISRYPNPGAALLGLHDLVKLRLDVNFTHMQTIVLAYLCEDPDNFDYRIPKLKSEGRLVPYNDVMVSRDIALAMSFQKHFDTFKSLRTHVIDQRHPHPHSDAMRG